MKNILAAILFLSSTLLLAQNNVLGSKVKAKAPLNGSAIATPVISKLSRIDDLQRDKFKSNTKISSIPSLNVTEEDLRRSARRSVRITPSKPIQQQLSISFFGEFTKDYFLLNYRPFAQDRSTYKYSGFIRYNAVRGRTYRVKIALDMQVRDGLSDNGATRSGVVLINLGGREYQIEVSGQNSDLDLLFKAEVGGITTIAVSPLQISRQSSSAPSLPRSLYPSVPTPGLGNYHSDALAIKYVQIDEI